MKSFVKNRRPPANRRGLVSEVSIKEIDFILVDVRERIREEQTWGQAFDSAILIDSKQSDGSRGDENIKSNSSTAIDSPNLARQMQKTCSEID